MNFDKYQGEFKSSLGSDDASELNTYSTGASAWISICLNRKMMDVSNVEYYFVDAEGERLDTVDERIALAIEEGFAGLSFGDMLAVACGHEDLTGNALWIKNTGKNRWTQINNITSSFVPIKPGNFKIEPDSKGLSVKYYEVNWPDGTREKYLPEDVIHYKRNPMLSPLYGIGLIAQGRLTVESDKVAMEYQNSYFNDKGTPDMVYIDKAEKNPDMARRKKQELMQAYSAGKFKNGVLYAYGEIAVQPVTVSASDLQFIETRGYNQQQIISLMESVGTVLGIPDANNRASATILKAAYYGIVNSRIKHLLDSFNKQFVHTIMPDISLACTKYPTGDINDEILAVQYGLITPADASKRLGRPYDIEDEAQNVRYINRSLQPITIAVDPPSLGMGFSARVESQKKKSWHELSHKELWTFDKATKRNSVGAKPWQMKLLEMAQRSREKTFKKYKPQIQDFFDMQADRIVKALEDLFTNKAAGDQLNASDVDNLVTILFPASEDALLIDATRSMHTSGVQKSIEDLNSVSSASVTASFTNPNVVLAVDELARRVTRANEVTKGVLRKTLTDGITAGKTITELAADVKDIIPETYQNRALTVARTETRLAYSAGTETSFKELEVEKFDVVGCVGTLAGTNELGLSASYGDFSESVGSCGVLNVDAKLMQSVAILHHPNHQGVEVPTIET